MSREELRQIILYILVGVWQVVGYCALSQDLKNLPLIKVGTLVKDLTATDYPAQLLQDVLGLGIAPIVDRFGKGKIPLQPATSLQQEALDSLFFPVDTPGIKEKQIGPAIPKEGAVSRDFL
jgi:hypothetical protein